MKYQREVRVGRERGGANALLPLVVSGVLAASCGARSIPEQACPSGQTGCGSVCVTLAEDPLNCGACANACTVGTVCSAGVCLTSCGAGTSLCTTSAGAYCADVRSDNANCGGCGVACGTGLKCSSGTCATECAAGLTACGATCVDLSVDGANCGDCGAICRGVCSGGRCTETLVNDVSIRGFDVDENASSLEWIGPTGQISIASFDGSYFGWVGNIDPVQDYQALRSLFGFTGQTGYWLDSWSGGCAIRHFGCCGNSSLVWSSSSQCYGRMWGDSQYLYWLAGYQSDNVRRIAYDDASGNAAIIPTGNAVDALAVDQGEIYWATAEGQSGTIAIWKMVSDGTSPTQLTASYPGNITGQDLVTNPTDVFWLSTGGSTTTLRSVSKTGGAPQDVATVGPGIAQQLASDGFFAYVSTSTPDRIVKIPLLGGATSTLVSAPDGTLGEFIVRSSLYYAENGRVLRTGL